jgi:hypothetical protein
MSSENTYLTRSYVIRDNIFASELCHQWQHICLRAMSSGTTYVFRSYVIRDICLGAMSLESTHFLWVMSSGTTYMCICPELCHQGHHICLGAMSLESTHFLWVMSSGTTYMCICPELCHQGQHICREGNTNLGIRPGIKHWPRVLSFLYLVIAFS